MNLTEKEERIINTYRRGFSIEMYDMNKNTNNKNVLVELGYDNIGSYTATNRASDVSWFIAEDGDDLKVISAK